MMVRESVKAAVRPQQRCTKKGVTPLMPLPVKVGTTNHALGHAERYTRGPALSESPTTTQRGANKRLRLSSRARGGADI